VFSGPRGVEPVSKATIQRFEADGASQRTDASGVRNSTGLAVHPQTGALWAVVQERDGLGDDLPSDDLIRVQAGGFYGWPYAYIGPHPQPGFATLAPDKVEATLTPDLLFQAHASALDLVFYDGAPFPAEMRGRTFVALEGSWNRSAPTGDTVWKVRYTGAAPAGPTCAPCPPVWLAVMCGGVCGFWAASKISHDRRPACPASLAILPPRQTWLSGIFGELWHAPSSGGLAWSWHAIRQVSSRQLPCALASSARKREIEQDKPLEPVHRGARELMRQGHDVGSPSNHAPRAYRAQYPRGGEESRAST
jgi:hypothetical protein